MLTPIYLRVNYHVQLLEELPECFPNQLQHFAFASAVYEGSNFPTYLPTFVILIIINIVIIIIVITMGIKWYLIMVLVYISHIERLCICLSSFEKYLLKSLAHFLSSVAFSLLVCKSSLYILHKSLIRYVIFKHVLPISRLGFHFLDCKICSTKGLIYVLLHGLLWRMFHDHQRRFLVLLLSGVLSEIRQLFYSVIQLFYFLVDLPSSCSI